MKKIYYSIGLVILIATSLGIYTYQLIFSNQIKNDVKFFIRSTDALTQVLSHLDTICIHHEDVRKVSVLKKYKSIKPGMYILKQGMNANDIINLIRSGNQTPVKVTFNNQNYIENLAGKLSHQIEADSLNILNSLTDKEFLKREGLTTHTVLNICMPYTYECYWSISPNQLRGKLMKAYRNFWNKERLQKSNQLRLSQNEIISLASIVQKETQHKPERRRIAGVYLNRIRKGIPLQADPTIVYALKEKHGRKKIFKRVLNKDLNISSPYNTYRNKGVPPSAIAMADIDAIDAVLNAERHSYYYFCANPNKIGTHSFAKNLAQHNRNAKVYQRWLNMQNIRR